MLDSMQFEARRLEEEAPPQTLLLAFLPLVLAVMIMLAVAFASFWFTSAARSYVAGESLWSKAQKDAISHLLRYAVSGDENDFSRYTATIAIPLGDRKARLALDLPAADLDSARLGFLQGGNHPDDVAALIALYRYFRHYPTFAEAVAIWVEAEQHIDRLQQVAAAMRSLQGAPDRLERAAALNSELNQINRALTPMEQAFSERIGQASRELSFVLQAATAVLAVLLVCFGFMQARYLVRRVRSAEGRVRRTTERLELATTAANDGVWEWNVETRTVFWTGRLRELLRFESNEDFAANYNLRSGVHPDDSTGLFNAIRQHFIWPDYRLDIQARLRCRDWSYRWFRLRGMAIRDTFGHPQRILGTLSDVDDHVRAIKAQSEALIQVHQSAADLELALDGANVALWTFEPQSGRVTQARRWKPLLGREHMPGSFEEWEALIHPDDRQRRRETMQAFLRRRTSHYEAEFRMLHVRGHWVWVRSRGRVTARGGDGEPLECAGVVMNISLQIAARQVQRRQHELLQAMIEGIDTGVVWANAARILYVNTSICRMLGFDGKDEMIGRPMTEFFAGEERADMLERQNNAMAGVEVPLLTASLRASDGALVRTVSALSHVPWNGKSHFIFTFTPLSEHQKLELRMQAANARFERVLLSELEAQQAHIARELHDSLGSVLAGLSLTVGGAQNVLNAQGQGRELLEHSQEQIRQAAEMTRALARGIMPVGSHPGALMHALEQFAQDFTVVKGVQCEFDVVGDFSDITPDVGNHVYRIVQEATSNATRHGRATRLRLRLAQSDSTLTMVVEDNGSGLTPRALGEARQGLGLRSMEARAKAIGGSISVEPREAGGCRVMIVWPRVSSLAKVIGVVESQ